MNKRKTVNERVSKKASINQFEKMIQTTSEDAETDNPKIEDRDPWKTRRQTYHIPEIIIDALQIQKAFEDKDISETVREALLEYIDDKYLDMAENKYR